MKETTIDEAQKFLTVKTAYGCKRILDIRHLLNSHSVGEVTDFLKSYMKEKEKSLKEMILIDKTHWKIDLYVGAMFRLQMSINILEREEVNNIEITKQSPTNGRGIYARHRRCHNRTGRGKDRSHDATDRTARIPTQRAA